MTGCPSEDELVRMVEGALGDASLASIESHVDHCERCAAVVAGLGAFGSSGGSRPGASRAGRRVAGRYQLDRRIAAGGMGEVWAAWDPQLRRDIAIKLVRTDRIDRADPAEAGKERERLLREARALARLGHPNVLAVHDVGELDGEVFIATELVAGETLASRGGASASWRELVRLYVQAARGLAAAHAAGLVHRDVKPANLLLGSDGRVRVADFGLAVRSSSPSAMAATELATDEVPVSITASGFVAGTPAYMAPEQRAGQPPDARADQYALCVSLVESLDGRRPPPALDREALIAFVTERRPREPELDALCGVLARGLTEDPRKRFADAGQLADALERAASARELESAQTLSAAELAPIPSSGSHTPPPAASSGASPAPIPTPTPMPASVPTSGAGPRATALERPQPTPPPYTQAAPQHAPRKPAPPRRRAVSIAIAGIAAAAGVAAVLVVARVALKQPARAPAVATGSAAPVQPSVEPIGPGSDAVAPVGPGSAAPVIAEGSGRTPARPGGAPLEVARTRPAKTVAISPPPPGGFADLSRLVTDMQKHLRNRDVRACRSALAAVNPGSVHPSAHVTVETYVAFCDMIAGDCAGGSARLAKAYAAQGIALTPAMYTEQYCPIEGDLETRLDRLRTQASAHTMGTAMDLAWCDALIPHARKAAGEVATGPQRGLATYALHQLAKCVASAGRCDQARDLWSLALTVDETTKWQKPDLGPRCAAASASLAATETFADATPLIQSLSNAVRARDMRGCQQLLATVPPNLHPSSRHSVELQQAHCEMLSGNCAAGTARLARIGPGPGNSTVNPSILTAWIDSQASTYCPITGDLDARMARLWSQVDGFTARGGGNLAWCDSLIPHAKTAAGEISTAAHRKRAVMILQRLAACVGYAGRCTDGHDLWALSLRVDPNALATPELGPKCP